MDADAFKMLLSGIDFSDEDLPDFTVDINMDAQQENKLQQETTGLNNDDIETFIKENQNHNTVRKTKSDLNILKKWFHGVEENRDILEIPPVELDKLLSHFFVKVRKADGTDYEPDSLTSFQRSIDRYIRENNKLYSILTDKEFRKSRESLEAKRKELRRSGKGRRPNKAIGLTSQEADKLWDEGQLGCHSPISLLKTVWFNNTLHFGWRARDEHRKLQQGDLQLKKEEGPSGREYVMWVTERGSKTRTGAKDKMPERHFNPRMYATNTERCPVKMYKTYLDRIPESKRSTDSPFYLAYICKPKTTVWYKASPLGINSLGNFMKDMAAKASLEGRHTNHSARRTMITKLRHENINPLDIAQLSGHKNLKSLDSYSEASEDQQRRMSLTISEMSGGNSRSPALKTDQKQNMSTSPPGYSGSMLPGAMFHNCTITFNCPGSLLDEQQIAKRPKIDL